MANVGSEHADAAGPPADAPPQRNRWLWLRRDHTGPMSDDAQGDLLPEDRTYTLRLVAVRPERFKAAFKPLSIELEPFNVVIGRNGSGKSTLLEALQWLDTAIRRDAREACDRYFGMSDLINARSQSVPPYFQIGLQWVDQEDDSVAVAYSIKVVDDNGLPRVESESLVVRNAGADRKVIRTEDGVRMIGTGASTVRVVDPDRLALALVGDTQLDDPVVRALQEFWARAVFLRLSPNRLAQGSPAARRSFEPILDEEGQQLPALLYELSQDQRADLADDIRSILPSIRNVEVIESGDRKDKRVNYNLFERMPYRGRSGRFQIPIPSWMLSEGTRRITALLALLKREPAPSIICVEEIENGLDPWTTNQIAARLQAGAIAGTQVLMTTHSPWLLDHVPFESILLVRRTDGETQYQHFAALPEVKAFDPSLPPGTVYANLALPRP